MYIDCLGENTKDINKCRNHFRNLPDISKNLRGWNGINNMQKRLFAYNVLNGLGLYGIYNKENNYTYVNDDGSYIMSDNEIIAALGLIIPTNIPAKLAYIENLMIIVGTIDTPNKKISNKTPSIRFGTVNIATSPTINPHIIGGPMLMGALLRPMIGGSDNSVPLVQYLDTGAQHIIRPILDKLELLKSKGRILPTDQRNLIDKRIREFQTIVLELNNYENVLASYLSVASQFNNKDITLTQSDVDTIKRNIDERKRKMSSKLTKFEDLNMRLLQVMN